MNDCTLFSSLCYNKPDKHRIRKIKIIYQKHFCLEENELIFDKIFCWIDVTNELEKYSRLKFLLDILPTSTTFALFLIIYSPVCEVEAFKI